MRKHQISFVGHLAHQHWDWGTGRNSCVAESSNLADPKGGFQYDITKEHFQISANNICQWLYFLMSCKWYRPQTFHAINLSLNEPIHRAVSWKSSQNGRRWKNTPFLNYLYCHSCCARISSHYFRWRLANKLQRRVNGHAISAGTKRVKCSTHITYFEWVHIGRRI